MKTELYHALSKLHLGNAVYPVVRMACRPCPLPPAEEAGAFLHTLSTREKSGCIADGLYENRKEYDLELIIPVYNVKDYLAQCLDSVLNQKTKYRTRVLCVEDGSTDGSGAVLDRYQSDPRVYIIRQENRGLSAARNRALRYRSCRYLTFLDSDDMLADGAIDLLLDAAYGHDADIVYGGYVKFGRGGKTISRLTTEEGWVSDPYTVPGFACGKIIRAELFDGVRFPEGFLFEDTMMRQIVYRRARTIYAVSGTIYWYRKNPNGISLGARRSNKSVDSVLVYDQIERDCRTLGLPCDQGEYESFLEHAKLAQFRMRNLKPAVQKAGFSVWCGMMRRSYADSRTEREHMRDLEQALISGNFNLFQAFCVLTQ